MTQSQKRRRGSRSASQVTQEGTEEQPRRRISFVGTQSSQASSSSATNGGNNNGATSRASGRGGSRRKQKRRLTQVYDEEGEEELSFDDEDGGEYVNRNNDDQEQELEFEESDGAGTADRTAGRGTRGRKRRRQESESTETAVDANEEAQSRQGYALTEIEFEALVGNFMRLALFKNTKKEPVKREELIELVLGEGYKKKKGLAQKIIDEAAIRFRKIFGFELTPIERRTTAQNEPSSSSQKKDATTVANAKIWILILAPKDDGIQYSNEAEKKVEIKADLESRLKEFKKDADAEQRALLMAILSLIQTNAGRLNEDLLYDYLSQLGLSQQTPHPIFGDLDKTIESFVKQLYLEKERDDTATQEEMGGSARRRNKYIFLPGPRLEKELGKRAVLDYMADLCDKELTNATLRENNLATNGTEVEE